MSIKGGSYARYRRSLASLDPRLVWPAALEVGRLAQLHDALALVLVLSLGDRAAVIGPDLTVGEAYQRARAKWLARLQQRLSLPWTDREAIDRALAMLPAGEYQAAALADLEAALRRHPVPECVTEIEAFQERLDG
jgi:hypothetical protein